ncbi:MAG: prephenate dehydrogenase [bacterium]
MSRIETVAVVGLGLMGGSLARALAARDVVVFGYDSVPDSLDAAEGEGIVHERLSGNLEGIEKADVVVFALPVDATITALTRAAPRLANTRLIMDVASTKRTIVATAETAGLGARYVGAHPLTGSHRSGWRASRATLFDDARVFLCPTPSTTVESLVLAESFWRSLRTGVEVLDAATHDEQMAWRSHLPQAMATALALVLHNAGIQRSALGPGGRDMTRLAGGSPDLWTSIAEDNTAALMTSIDALEEELRRFRSALLTADQAGIREYFTAGRDWFDGTPMEPLTARIAST